MEHKSTQTASLTPVQPTVSGSTSITNPAPRIVDPVTRDYITKRFITVHCELIRCLDGALDVVGDKRRAGDEIRPLKSGLLAEQLRQSLVSRGIITESNHPLMQLLDECMQVDKHSKQTLDTYVTEPAGVLVSDIEDAIFMMRKIAQALSSEFALLFPEVYTGWIRPAPSADELKFTGPYVYPRK